MINDIYNTTLFYQFSATPAAPTFDPVTGSPIFSDPVQQMELSMEIVSDANINVFSGADTQVVEVYGRFRNATDAAVVRPNHKYRVEYDWKPPVRLEGELVLKMDASSRLGLEKYLGVPFEGFLTLYRQ